jgi:hypothetical protein
LVLAGVAVVALLAGGVIFLVTRPGEPEKAKPPPLVVVAPKPLPPPPAPPAPPAPVVQRPKPVEAKPAEVQLQLTSSPGGAQVFANGKAVGKTPMSLSWPSGQPLKLKLTKGGYRAATRDLTPGADDAIELSLKKAPKLDELKDVY